MKVGNITDEIRERILEENDLREVAEEYGVKFDNGNKASCPFHNDGRNGNLHLHEKKDSHPTYHCYQDDCRAGTMWEDKAKTKRHFLRFPDGEEIEDGGPNVIGFVMNIERCTYIDACVILMERAGIPVPQAKIDYKVEKKKKKVHSLNVKYCQTLFKTPGMLEYLKERGIQKDSIKKWRLGYVEENDHGNPNFGKVVAGRLVFGLKEHSYNPTSARTIAMAYRSMNGEGAKYLNDPTDNDLYKKSEYLYGFTEGRKAIKQKGFAFVMEGYTDVIIAHQSGLENVVATCGTSFTDGQIEKLRKLTKNLIFWFDGDMAGINAMLADVEQLVEAGFRVKVVIANGKDPAEWMNDLGQDYETIMNFVAEHARPALQVISDMALRKYETEMQKLKVDVLDELLPLIDKIADPSERVVFKSNIENRLGVRL